MARFILSAFADEASADIREQIAACKQNGIGFIELRNVNGKNISDFTVDEAKELKELLDSEGMGVSSIGSHYGKIEITDDLLPILKRSRILSRSQRFSAQNISVCSASISETANPLRSITRKCSQGSPQWLITPRLRRALLP